MTLLAALSKPAQWPWPLPAVLAWGLSWLVYVGLQHLETGPVWALALAGMLSVLCSLWGQTWWRRAWIGLGFVGSLLASGALSMPAWAWLLALLTLLLIYPLNAWRDAPLFPTPHSVLNQLAASTQLAPGALVLDAGCGLGDGLIALRQALPQARWHGLEWSWPLRALCALRCPWARVRQGDIWQADWSGYDLVYLFQRPESMPKAAAKARAELRRGSYLVSLEFEATQLPVHAKLDAGAGRPLWVYRMG